MTKKRFIVDDAGTLIDMQTRDMFDIVEEVCPLLNILVDENKGLKRQMEFVRNHRDKLILKNKELEEENKQLKKRC